MRGIHSMRAGLQLDGGTLPLERLDRTTSAPTPSRASGVPRRHAAELHPPHRRSEHRLQQRPGRRLRAGRHPGPQEPHAQPGRALRSADAPVGRQQLRAAVRRHLVARQERQDDAARQRRDLLRLAVDRHLRADAARRRLPPARAEHHQSAVPESGERGRHHVGRPTATCSSDDLQMQRNVRFSAGVDRGGHADACAST